MSFVEMVPFIKDDVRDYLDACIQKWRKIRDADHREAAKARYSIDALQSVRASIFGKMLELNSKGSKVFVGEPTGIDLGGIHVDADGKGEKAL